MFRRRLLTAAIVAAVAACVAPANATAGFSITFSGGGAASPVTVVDDGAGDTTPSLFVTNTITTTTFIFGDYVIQLNANHNSPGSPTSSWVAQNTFNVQRFSTGMAAPLTIRVTADGFTSPGTSAIYNSISSTDLKGRADVASRIDWNDPLLGSVMVQTSDATLTGPINSATPSAQKAQTTGGIATLGTPFAITEIITISGLAQNEGMKFDTRTDVAVLNPNDAPPALPNLEVTPVPAPAGLILAVTAVPFFGLLRRRMKTVPTT